ncbi:MULTISPECIES: hypothetical protein [Streptomyces]|uniref:hypothetical protein n=1 Tax=Streptomyces TaxID=1883 RepID=UPI002DDB5BB6|nr:MULTISPECIES: hypothetical protein [unclassified Streptomyces]WSD97813.1 hypothetical protein OG758_28875 [Streptomyces sp. NBC_01474]
MRRSTLAALCLTAVTATLSLTACGTGGPGDAAGPGDKPKAPFADLSGPQIANKAMKATRGASSLTIKGNAADGDGGQIALDVALDKKGDCAGSMGMKGQGKVDLIKTGPTMYLKSDEAFLRAQSEGESKADTDAVVKMLAGRWMKSKADSPDTKDMADFCDLDSMLAEFKSNDTLARKGRATTVDGTPAFTVTETDGKDEYTLYVATEGKPYVLKLVTKSAKEPGALTFSDYDKPVEAAPPADKDIVDLDKMGG